MAPKHALGYDHLASELIHVVRNTRVVQLFDNRLRKSNKKNYNIYYVNTIETSVPFDINLFALNCVRPIHFTRKCDSTPDIKRNKESSAITFSQQIAVLVIRCCAAWFHLVSSNSNIDVPRDMLHEMNVNMIVKCLHSGGSQQS